ncbi:hypothetical protein HOLleu_22633 [Holothuria leucospilota]|uniref:Uncharacterized protein n=1 Tax=Holothuria leucospilota TaxID=206669 RepID=A0A9Q1BZG7_HOLLE|nr:hypothetical protein HOLleu_22633 [Holothuria leucospilota]
MKIIDRICKLTQYPLLCFLQLFVGLAVGSTVWILHSTRRYRQTCSNKVDVFVSVKSLTTSSLVLMFGSIVLLSLCYIKSKRSEALRSAFEFLIATLVIVLCALSILEYFKHISPSSLNQSTTITPIYEASEKKDCHGVFVGYSVIYCSAVLAIFVMGLITYVAAGRSITDVWRRLKYDDV